MAERQGRAAYAPRMAPEQRREQLLDAVLRVIVRQGVHKVSIDTVAKEAGVSRPVVYGLFDDSDQLLLACLDREEAGAVAQMATVVQLSPRDDDDPARALADSLGRFLDVVQAAPDRWRAAFQLADSSTPAFRRRLERGRQVFTEALAAYVRASVTSGRLASTDVELTARLIHALFWEAGRLVLAEPDAFPPQRIRDYVARLLPALPTFRSPSEA
ncbi:TetR/AcrR family transcriptional regulator [Nocardia sp. NPDC058379]|uniref:TetR/AcrR family transcriptional regulator n=1 Tax=unclassified Nocardia TaxID=2637762 RepID=UPI00365A23AF